jgi:hypothetical protein
VVKANNFFQVTTLKNKDEDRKLVISYLSNWEGMLPNIKNQDYARGKSGVLNKISKLSIFYN